MLSSFPFARHIVALPPPLETIALYVRRCKYSGSTPFARKTLLATEDVSSKIVYKICSVPTTCEPRRAATSFAFCTALDALADISTTGRVGIGENTGITSSSYTPQPFKSLCAAEPSTSKRPNKMCSVQTSPPVRTASSLAL